MAKKARRRGGRDGGTGNTPEEVVGKIKLAVDKAGGPRQLAKLMNVDVVTVWRWRTGKAFPGRDMAWELGQFMGVAADSFIVGRPKRDCGSGD